MIYNYTFNRPISPHLSIYSPQISSMFSIWHRISGVLLIFGLALFLIMPKILVSLSFSFLVIYFPVPTWFFSFIYLSYSFIFAYHALNGVRHITWDLFLFLDNKSLNLSVVFLFFILIKTVFVI